jgi:hypothetical protein
VRNWTAQGTHSNALAASLRLLKVAKAIGWDWMIAAALDYTTQSIKAGGVDGARTARDVFEAIEGLPDAYNTEADVIRQLARAARER